MMTRVTGWSVWGPTGPDRCSTRVPKVELVELFVALGYVRVSSPNERASETSPDAWSTAGEGTGTKGFPTGTGRLSLIAVFWPSILLESGRGPLMGRALCPSWREGMRPSLVHGPPSLSRGVSILNLRS